MAKLDACLGQDPVLPVSPPQPLLRLRATGAHAGADDAEP